MAATVFKPTIISEVLKQTLNHFNKQTKWLTCVVSTYLYGIHLNFRYCACFEEGVPWHSGNYRVYFHSEMCTWHDNDIQGLHFPGTIWYRMINITFYFSAEKCLKLLGIIFILKFYAQVGKFTKIFCIWKRLSLKELVLEEAHFNAYI